MLLSVLFCFIPDSDPRRHDSDAAVVAAVVACDGLDEGVHARPAWHVAAHHPYAHHNPYHRRMPSIVKNLKQKNFFFSESTALFN